MALEKDIQDLSIPSMDMTDAEAMLSQPLYGWQRFIAPFKGDKNHLFTLGLICIALSTLIFMTLHLSEKSGSEPFSIGFVFCFVITLVYGISLMFSRRLSWFFFSRKENRATTMLYLTLWLISCFALNRSLPIFNEAADWWSVAVVLASATAIAYGWKEYFSVREQQIYDGFVAASLLVFLSYTITLIPYIGISIPVFWFFLIPVHAWIPLILCIYLIKILRENETPNYTAILTGLAIPIAAFSIFTLFWTVRVHNFQEIINKNTHKSDASLPQWVNMSQRLPKDAMTERVLKSTVVYPVYRHDDAFFSTNLFSRTGMFAGQQRYDPFVFGASIFTPVPEMDMSDRIQIYKSIYGNRHEANDQLWTGESLFTDKIETKAEIDPTHRLAYTEKFFVIKNASTFASEQGEAIYTFSLPEGSVVSSLSLWINGVEEKAILTTKAKADEAYRTIVGMERRDPSVVHWQEGNQVTVRVFPVRPDLPRQFKIGVTSPLLLENDRLYYQNITLQGPTVENSEETVEMKILDTSTKFDNVPSIFKADNQILTYKGESLSDWNISMAAPRVSEEAFGFNNKTYRIEPFLNETTAFTAENIYLDINSAWTSEELTTVWKAAKNKPTWVWYENNFKQLDENNAKKITSELKENRFSLFPFHRLLTPEKALIITKSALPCPNLDDLKGSEFGEAVKKGLKNIEPIRVFHIGKTVSPYQKTFKELRITNMYEGNVSELTDILNKNLFYAFSETPNTVIIPSSGVRIVETASVLPINTAKGTDHLLRLFAYNSILKDVNKNIFDPQFFSQYLIDLASKANIVTPVSSLIVLESKADYERFDINASKNSLGNASLKNSGAVPEPHEWALMALMAAMIGWLFLKRRL